MSITTNRKSDRKEYFMWEQLGDRAKLFHGPQLTNRKVDIHNSSDIPNQANALLNLEALRIIRVRRDFGIVAEQFAAANGMFYRFDPNAL